MEEKKSIIFNSSKIAQAIMNAAGICGELYVSDFKEEISELVSKKIEEIKGDIEKNNIKTLSKKLGYKLNTSRLKKVEVDFRLRKIAYEIIESKKFKDDIDNRVACRSKILFLSRFSIIEGNISNEDDFFRELVELVNEVTIEELFSQVKMRENDLLINILFEKKEISTLKSILLRMMKYIKLNYKNSILSFIKDIIISIIANIITKTNLKPKNRSVKSSCYYFA
ncbi:hypothetical protein JHL18_00615 [Clostridium sp. YIM B02505]|uniref:Uncharacterized protein n=1 Tax=Clostridium yunnanense TaxID=2800325 RepID=A0ABS1EIE0_9CLOT|nr:hypothetical protein [Clostridium yunnanense]MBK1809150.1 hypothetical protein [Clostridium yunnanense]